MASENYYRERLMLFLTCRNEGPDLCGGFDTFEAHYRAKEDKILDTRLKYEGNNDIHGTLIEEAIEKDIDTVV